MKPVFNFILIFLITIPAFAGDGKTGLTIKTNRDAVIIFDGKVFCGKKLFVNVEKGIHIVKIKNNLRMWDFDTIIDTLKIDGSVNEINKEYFLSVPVFLQTVPDDALVFAGRKPIGYTPLYLPGGLRKVKLIKNNFEKTIRLNKKKIFLNLGIPVNKVEETNFTDDVWFKVLLGGIVGFGATSAYFKLKADEYYDRYLKTKDETFLNKTNNYDLISGIALGVLQINFGILIYHFLIE